MAPDLIERVDTNLIEDNPDEERLLFGPNAENEDRGESESQDRNNEAIVNHDNGDHKPGGRHSDLDHALLVATFERSASDRLDDPHIFVLDSGASATSSPHLQGVVRTRQLSNREILAFDGHPMAIVNKYDMRGIAKDKEGADVARVTITGINHVPTARFNLFSATYAVSNGWTFYGDPTGVTLNKGTSKMKFDLLIPTGTGFLYAIRIVPDNDSEVGAVAIDKPKATEQFLDSQNRNNKKSEEQTAVKAPMEGIQKEPVTLPRLTRQLIHYRMCHVNQRDAEKVAKYFGYDLYTPRNGNTTDLPLAQNVRNIVMCEACQVSRTKRHGVKKISNHIPAAHPNERVFVDISTVREAGGFPLTKGVCIGHRSSR